MWASKTVYLYFFCIDLDPRTMVDCDPEGLKSFINKFRSLDKSRGAN